MAASASFFCSTAALSLLLLLCSAVGGHQLHDQPSADRRISRHWRFEAYPPPSQLHRLTIALKQQNLEKLEETVAAVSSPRSERYGDYLSLDQVRRLVAPPAETVETVVAFLKNHGAETEVVYTQDFVVATLPVRAVNEAFNVQLAHYRHALSGRLLRRTLHKPIIPAVLAPLIDVITGLDDFPDFRAERRQPAWQAASQDNTTAPQISQVYGSASDVAADVVVYCKNGAVSSTVPPCQDFPPIVTTVTLSVAPQGYSAEAFTKSFGVTSLACNALEGATVCTTAAIHIPPYVRANISSWVQYSDGSSSLVGYYGSLHAPSPFITPQAIYEMYQVPRHMRGTHPNNSQSVVAFEQQYINIDTDLTQFFEAMGLPFQMPIIHGTNNASMPGGESTLDIQYVMGVGAGIPTTFWSVSGDPGSGGYILEWAMEISNTTNPPLVTSISYGDTEDGYFNKFGSWDYINRMNFELAKMAARGLTVIAGSGDAGASNVGEDGNDLSPTDPTCTPFRPFYPSDSPYVLSVSATFLTNNYLPVCQDTLSGGSQAIVCEDVGEVAVSVGSGLFWTTGGGFSNFTAQQPWQSDAIQGYLNQSSISLPPQSIWNITGRGYPDIATIGHNLLLVWNGVVRKVDGTSASGPVLAGLVGLLNDARLNAGLPSMGLMNPWLYQISQSHGEAFTDVTVGRNSDGDLQLRGSPYPSTCAFGFDCATGWDPVTGLGSPNWDVWRTLALL